MRWLLIALLVVPAYARDGDNHGNHGDLKLWFDKLSSGRGLCCSFADGEIVKDVDWDAVTGADGKVRYRVYLDGDWLVVADEAVITEPNRFGQAVVWPIRYNGKVYNIRCFIPGAGT
jgi:hypothetical protein